MGSTQEDGVQSLSNWGVFGPDDEIGAVNYLTESTVLAAASCVTTGERFTLNLPLDIPGSGPAGAPVFKPDAPGYRRVSHRVNKVTPSGQVVNDDHIILPTQGSTQWDSFAHVGLIEDGVDGVFYNGVPKDAVDEQGYAHRNGIDKLAQVGIVGRGVLLDIARMAANGNSDPLPLDYVCTVERTQQCMQEQGVEMQLGDIVCFRTGWTEAFLRAGEDERRAMTMHGSPVPGITSDHAPLAHKQRWAAVVADNPGVETIPMDPDPRLTAHVRMLRNLGIPFGELFDFGDLSSACANDGRWYFLFVAVPLWIPGGIGSPGNAIAIR
jgi:kynurenine formamidase